MDNNRDPINNDQWVEERLAALRPDGEWRPDTSRGLASFHERLEKKSHRKRTWGWVAAGVVAAGVPLMALPATRAFAQRCVSACVGQFSLVTSTASSGFVKPQNRKMASDFVLNDASGKTVRLSDLRGKVVLLNFWATWCAPCRVEIPWFIEFQNASKNAGFTTLGVSLDEDGWDAARPYIEQHKINYPVVIGNDDLAQMYGAGSLPTTFIIDKAGRIAATHVGLCGKGEYEADIRAVLNE